ncbi:MAG TPA: FAD-dependent oxidoreductase [Kiritimatiellia bacterium]|nr:FAD-dependent oxidoreductase [Kiritimatiellia bacterium]
MSRAIQNANVVVMGAGLTGSCIALELAQRGIDVVLVERDALPMNRASLRNEGKIHLGLIYANDASMQTASTQLQGALQFRRLLASRLGAGADRISVSTPFHYIVARDSVLSPDELEAHYDRLQAAYEGLCADDASCDYLGARPERLAHRLPRAAWHPAYRAESAAAVFETAERAIDPADLAREIRSALAAEPRIALRTGHEADAIQLDGDALVVEGRYGDTRWRIRARSVVNALWEQRLRFDAQMGLPPGGDWLHRLKYRVIVKTPDALRAAPSATVVLGRYGDVVIRPGGTAYLSWYPAGLRGWTNATTPPEAWDAPCRGEVDEALRTEIVEQSLAGLADWCPSVRGCSPLTVDAGAIVAVGHTDVDDRASGLHDRSRIGVTTRGGYHSVEPGKLTTAPLFAREAAERVAVQLGARV